MNILTYFMKVLVKLLMYNFDISVSAITGTNYKLKVVF